MAKRYLLTIMPETDEGLDYDNAATEVISEDDAKDILASFGAISYKPGTFVPNYSEWFVMKCKMERGEEAIFFYNDCVDDSPWMGKIINA